MSCGHGDNKNKAADRREYDGTTYFVRGEREVAGTAYQRYAVQTHFVERGESFLELMRRYILPLHRPGDVVTLGEKVISMCQDNTVEMKDVKLGFWAKFLSKFATSNSYGIAMDEPYKLQLAINLKGLPRILFASIIGGICRLFGKRGVFYRIAGQDIAGIDGFYKNSSFEVYHTLAVLNPRDPDGVCAEIEAELGIACVLVDANDLNVEVLGRAPSLMDKPPDFYAELIRDNPAGQDDELTPFVIIRPAEGEAPPADEQPADGAPADEMAERDMHEHGHTQAEPAAAEPFEGEASCGGEDAPAEAAGQAADAEEGDPT